MGPSPYLQMGRIDVPAAIEEEFNDWYNWVYIPTYLTVPGVIRARRYLAVDGQPKYLTVYEFERPDVPDGEAWHRARESSPWSRRIRPQMRLDPGSPAGGGRAPGDGRGERRGAAAREARPTSGPPDGGPQRHVRRRPRRRISGRRRPRLSGLTAERVVVDSISESIFEPARSYRTALQQLRCGRQSGLRCDPEIHERLRYRVGRWSSASRRAWTTAGPRSSSATGCITARGAAGPTKGGIRYHPDVSPGRGVALAMLDELEVRARWSCPTAARRAGWPAYRAHRRARAAST